MKYQFFSTLTFFTPTLLVAGVVLGHAPAPGGSPALSPVHHFLSVYASTSRFGWGILVAMVCYAVLLFVVAMLLWKSPAGFFGRWLPSSAFAVAAALMLVVAAAPARPLYPPGSPPPSAEERARTDHLQHVHDVAIMNSMRLQWLGMFSVLLSRRRRGWMAGWLLFSVAVAAFFLLPFLNFSWLGLWQRIGLGAMVAWLALAGRKTMADGVMFQSKGAGQAP